MADAREEPRRDAADAADAAKETEDVQEGRDRGGASRAASPAPVSSRRHVARARRAAGGYRIGDVVGKAFSVWGSNLAPFSVLALLIMSPALALDIGRMLGLFEVPDPPVAFGVTGYTVLRSVLDHLLQQFLAATLMFGIFQRLRRRPVSVGESVARGLSCLFPALGVGLVVSVVLAACWAPLWLAVDTAFGFEALLAGVVAFLALASVLIAAIPAAVVERLSVGAALKRSLELTRGYFWRVFLTLVLAQIVMLVVSLLLGAIVYLTLWVESPSVSGVVSLLLAVPVYALFAAVVGVIYHDLRVAKEGIDTAELATIFD